MSKWGTCKKYRQDPTIPRNDLKFEYLSIGTAFDRTGHFMLRLLSTHSQLLKEFVASSEAIFTIERLEFLSSTQIFQLIKTALRHLDEVSENYVVWRTELKYIFTEIKAALKCSHILNFNHDEKCTELDLKVPFQMCLSLVAKRELHLERGNVVVPCGKWKLFLKCLLEAFVKKEINKIEYNEALAESVSDHRLQELKDIVLTTFLKNSVPSTVSETVNSNEIEKLKALFPPCMGYLYSNLKINHRLSHSARFNFSLFLKDIGMPLNESITFWRNEYSKQSKCQSKCSHSWQKNSTKYTYSIRHLYGLEGKRANYSAPSCSKIQGNNLGASDEGGCPFLNFDINQLKNILDPTIVQNKEDFDLVMLLKSQNKTLEACNYYCKSLSKAANLGTLSEKCEHKTPVEYFVMLNKQLNYLDDR